MNLTLAKFVILTVALSTGNTLNNGRFALPSGIILHFPEKVVSSLGSDLDVSLEEVEIIQESSGFYLKFRGNLPIGKNVSFRCEIKGKALEELKPWIPLLETFRGVLEPPPIEKTPLGLVTTDLELKLGEDLMSNDPKIPHKSHIYLGSSMYPILTEVSRVIDKDHVSNLPAPRKPKEASQSSGGRIIPLDSPMIRRTRTEDPERNAHSNAMLGPFREIYYVGQ